MQVIPLQGLMVTGHNASPRQARELADAWLRARGVTDWDLDGVTLPAAQAWWGDDEVGFVGKEHENATPVTVVTLPAKFHHLLEPENSEPVG